jgi:hypothetical protein
MVSKNVDFVFVIDATGLMAITAAHDRVVHIARTVRETYPASFDFQFGCICYGDGINNGIPSQTFEFNRDAEALRNWLMTVEAKGGGDDAKDLADVFRLLCNLPWRTVLFATSSGSPIHRRMAFDTRRRCRSCCQSSTSTPTAKHYWRRG